MERIGVPEQDFALKRVRVVPVRTYTRRNRSLFFLGFWYAGDALQGADARGAQSCDALIAAALAPRRARLVQLLLEAATGVEARCAHELLCEDARIIIPGQDCDDCDCDDDRDCDEAEAEQRDDARAALKVVRGQSALLAAVSSDQSEQPAQPTAARDVQRLLAWLVTLEHLAREATAARETTSLGVRSPHKEEFRDFL